jgi:hypothetical protein
MEKRHAPMGKLALLATIMTVPRKRDDYLKQLVGAATHLSYKIAREGACVPWCKSSQAGSDAGCQRYWPLTWPAILG